LDGQAARRLPQAQRVSQSNLLFTGSRGGWETDFSWIGRRQKQSRAACGASVAKEISELPVSSAPGKIGLALKRPRSQRCSCNAIRITNRQGARSRGPDG